VRITTLLKPEYVFLDVAAATREALLDDVAQRLSGAGAIKNSESVAELLLERERLGSTVVEEGIAVPHCKVPGLKSIVVSVARTASSIPFGEGTAQLFFFVLSPREQPAAHLQVLAGIARLLRNPQAREACLTATSGEQLLTRLARLETGSVP